MGIAQTFGAILQANRKDQDITVKELSALCGVSQVAIGSWERGQIAPTLENAAKALRPLGFKIQIVRIKRNEQPKTINKQREVIRIR